MKNTFCALLLLAFLFQFKLQAQETPNFGIGFKVGDLTGISLKKYLGESALEFNVGRVIRYRIPNYEKSFYKFKEFNDSEFEYLGHQTEAPLAVQLHFMKHRPIAGGLNWYYGIGAQARVFPINYLYSERTGPGQWIKKEKLKHLWKAGIDWNLGLEYTFESVPIGLYADVLLFMEIIDNPFVAHGMYGIGARYNF